MPSVRPQDMRQMARAGVMDQAMQDPMQQIMQMMQVQQGAQQMQQAQEESPIQMALRQLQLEAQQQALMSGQQQFQQNEQMFPLNMAREQAMVDYYNQRAVPDPMQQLMGGIPQGGAQIDPQLAQYLQSQNQ